MGIKDWLITKLNPAQPEIVDDFGEDIAPSKDHYNNQKAYNTVGTVSRGVDLIVDAAASIKVDVGEIQDWFTSETRIRKKKLTQLLTFRPNPYHSADVFFRNIYTDLILEGDAFMYFDGAFLYNLPALKVEIITDKKTYIKGYRYGNTSFKTNEIIHIKENSGDSIYQGKSRLDAAKPNINLLMSMNDFQKNFFDNSAIPGIILKTPNPLSDRVKDRMVRQWMSKYNPRRGGKRPLILDGDFTVESLSKYNFKELDFSESIKLQEQAILKALGVPPILLDSGNNANISPNLRMFYINTVMPLVDKVIQSLEFFFGYDIKAIEQNVLALRPELRESANYYSTLVNAGILTRNEVRKELRYEDSDTDFADDLILPANVAGSNYNSTEGGKPPTEEPNNEDE